MTSAAANYSPERSPLRLPQHAGLGALLLLEILVFSIIGRNFLIWDNLFLNLRISTELGLLALAATPVIVTGGIDLSVGSLLGLCAVGFGKLWRDVGLDPWTAAAGAVAIGRFFAGSRAAEKGRGARR